jgi:tetratricopeptide (TPR) repeat protein
MHDRQIHLLIEQAEVQRRLGNHRGATELAQRALTIDPDHAVAHAALAAILLDARRQAGAAVEIRLALGLDAHDPYIHRIAAAVLGAQRKFDDAWAHCLIALEDDPPVEAFVVAAEIRQLQDERDHARELLQQALEKAPAHVGALTELARLELGAGHRDEAARLIQLALESDPGDRDAHVVAGQVELLRGDAAAAEQHARFVLGQNATDRRGLELWAQIQARRSWLLGAWWRWAVWMSLQDDRRRIAIAIAAFVVARVAIIVTDELGFEGLSGALRAIWIALCVYTWFAPAVFEHMVARSLRSVRLDPEF